MSFHPESPNVYAGSWQEEGWSAKRSATSDFQWGRLYRGESKVTNNTLHLKIITILSKDFEDFDLANEDDVLEEFLGIERENPKVKN